MGEATSEKNEIRNGRTCCSTVNHVTSLCNEFIFLSWTRLSGYGANKGIVPITCEELFKSTRSLSLDGDKTFQIAYSMLEIYNENVRDLLVGAGDGGKKSPPQQQQRRQQPLKVRQNPKYGFYVEGLKVVPVESYDHIKSLMEQGRSW